jgi:hypothetical protein
MMPNLIGFVTSTPSIKEPLQALPKRNKKRRAFSALMVRQGSIYVQSNT